MNIKVNRKYTKDDPKSYIFFEKILDWTTANHESYKDFERYLNSISCIEYVRLVALATLTMNQYLEDVITIDRIALSTNAKDRAKVCGDFLINEFGCDFKLKDSSDIIILLSHWILHGTYCVNMLARVDYLLDDESISQELKEVVANGVRSIIQCNNNHNCKVMEYSIFSLMLIERLRCSKDDLIEENNQPTYLYSKSLEVFLVNNDSIGKKKAPKCEIKDISEWVILKPNPYNDDLSFILRFIQDIDTILNKTSNGEFINTIIRLEDDYINTIKSVIKDRVDMGFKSEGEINVIVEKMISQLCKDNIINNLYYRQYVKEALSRYCMSLIDSTTYKPINTKHDILLQLFSSGKIRSADLNSNVVNITFEYFITDKFKHRKTEITEMVKNTLQCSQKKDVATIVLALGELGYIKYEKSSKNHNLNKLHSALCTLVGSETNIGTSRHLTGTIDSVRRNDLEEVQIALTV